MMFQQPGEDYQEKIHDYRAGKEARVKEKVSQFSSVHLFHQFLNTKEYTFTIKMYKTSRKKERKRQTVNYYKNQI